jgi:hypothetical protein
MRPGPLTGDVVALRGSLLISPEHRRLRHTEETNGAAFDRLAADSPVEQRDSNRWSTVKTDGLF